MSCTTGEEGAVHVRTEALHVFSKLFVSLLAARALRSTERNYVAKRIEVRVSANRRKTISTLFGTRTFFPQNQTGTNPRICVTCTCGSPNSFLNSGFVSHYRTHVFEE